MKRILAFILAMSLIFCLAACGDEEKAPAAENGGADTVPETSKEFTAETVLTSAKAITSEVKSMRANMDLDMSVTAQGETVDMDMNGKMEYNIETGLAFVDMDMEAMGQSMDMTMYMQYGDGTVTLYTNMMGMWMKQSVDIGDLSSLGMGYDGINELTSYLENMENARMEKVGNEYKVSGNFGGVLTEDLISSSMSNLTGIGDFSEDQVRELIKCFEDVEFVLYIDASTYYPTSVQMDLGEAMEKMFALMPEGENLGIEDIKYIAKIDYYDYNKDIQITIPDEALSAQEMSIG